MKATLFLVLCYLPTLVICYIFGYNIGLGRIPLRSSSMAPSAAALYESQIRDLTLEIHARETELDNLVRALDATARERDAAISLVRQLQRGRAL